MTTRHMRHGVTHDARRYTARRTMTRRVTMRQDENGRKTHERE
ncbi:hypothetical protein [Negativicoccus succinicivorans]|nr:hypothetical protein [Negativicoccus succinicivorans]